MKDTTSVRIQDNIREMLRGDQDGSEYVRSVYALVLVWGLGDTVSTYAALAASGNTAMEANPWIRHLLSIDPLLIAVLKAAVVLYAGVVLLASRPIIERVPGYRLWFLAVVGAGVLTVVNNLAIAIHMLFV